MSEVCRLFNGLALLGYSLHDGCDVRRGFFRGLGRANRQIPRLIGHNRETGAELPGPGFLARGFQSQGIRLMGDGVDGLRDVMGLSAGRGDTSTLLYFMRILQSVF